MGVIVSTPLKAAVERASFASVELFSGGKRVGYIGSGNAGHGSLFLFNPEGGVEVQMGAYDSGAEKGQTLMGLHDKKGSLRLLMRLHGAQDSPVIVMKGRVGMTSWLSDSRGPMKYPTLSTVAKTAAWRI